MGDSCTTGRLHRQGNVLYAVCDISLVKYQVYFNVLECKHLLVCRLESDKRKLLQIRIVSRICFIPAYICSV